MWQPIKTAPKDGSWVLVTGPTPWLPDMVRWQPERRKRDSQYTVPAGWFTGAGPRSRYDDGSGQLTNAAWWMPLPAPPTDET